MQDTLGHTGKDRTFGERFRAIRLLKEGQGLATWLVEDLTTGARLVLKTTAVAHLAKSVQHRLEHEAGILRRLENRCLAPLIHVGVEGGSFYFVVPFVTGSTLEERLGKGPLTPLEAIRVGCCVLSALREAHDQGVLHQDIKPANIMLTSAGGDTPAAVLIDFGLARSRHLDASLRQESVGTVRYTSPEQAGLIDGDVDERSDLYSFGAVLFESLAGRPLFDAPSITEVLRQHMTAPAPDLRSLGVQVPRALEAVLRRLLEKDPRDRYQSAEGVLADLRAIEEALRRGEAEPALVLGLSDRRQTLTEPAFVGRTASLAKLEAQVEAAARGRGTMVFVEAESGGGKTRLLDELAQRSWRTAWILRGQGVAAEASRPFQILTGVAAELSTTMQADPTLAAALRQRLGDQREAICAALPELERVLQPTARETLGPEAFGEARTLQALDKLLRSLGTAARPALVMLDDCQWADEFSLKLLQHCSPRQGAGPTLEHTTVVVSFRSDEVRAQHPLRKITAEPHVVLPPLDAADMQRLVESMAGPLPPEVVTTAAELSGGSPFMTSAVLRGMIECGALTHLPTGWKVSAEGIANVRSSRQAAAFLVRRVELMPPDVQDLLSAGAVIGRSFDLDLAAGLAGQSAGEALAAIAGARQRHMVWAKTDSKAITRSEGKVEGIHCVFVHDKVREALLARLPEAERRDLHRCLAIELEDERGDRAFEISYHYDAAGEPDRALPHALVAGDRARAQHALDLAEQQYRIALRGSAGADDHTRRRIADGLGDVLLLRGRYDEAEEHLTTARGLSSSDTARAEIETKLGDLAFKRGDVTTACLALERGLRLLGRIVPRGPVVTLAMCLWEVLVQTAHTLAPRLFLRRRRKAAVDELLAIRVYSRLAHAYWFARGKIPCGWAHLREMNLAERYEPTAELAQAYSEHAPVITMLPWFERGISYAQKSLNIRRALGDVWGQGQSLHFYGIVLYAASRYRECLEKCREATALLARTGDQWELNTANWHIAFAQYRLGDLAAAAEAARKVHQAGAAIGDAQAMGISLGVWAKASGGKVPEGLLRAALVRKSEDVHTTAEVLQAEAIRALHAGDAATATRALERADGLITAKGFRQEYVAPVLPWLATALRAELEAASIHAPARRYSLLRRLRKTVQRSLRMARSYRNNLPHALREAAYLAAIDGEENKARKLLDRSIAVAVEQGARHEQAQSLRARGQLGMAHGWAGAETDIAQAESMTFTPVAEAMTISESGHAEVTLSLVDRFDQLLERGRGIASALSKQAILSAAREAALTLLRGERCDILELDEQDRVLAPPEGGRYSQSIIAQAISTGKTVLVAEGPTEAASESLILSGLRSALCAPIFVRGRAAACLYVSHSRVGRLFGEDEEKIAHFVATLTGAALENAEGFAKIEEALRIRDEFLAIASHELKTPLTPLQLQIDDFQRLLARSGAITDGVTQRLETMGRQTMRLSKLIENLLDLSRIAAGQLTLQREEHDFREVLRELIKRLGPEAQQKGCSITLVANEPLWGRWDQLRLDQVASNLVANAVKYGAGKPVEVHAEMSYDDLVLTVSDRGIGLSPQDAARVFERFERAVSVRHYGGLGLGLYISRQIVDAHGGTIAVESRLGEGAKFTVRIPRNAAPITRSHEAA